MIVCLCEGVSDHQIKHAIRGGCRSMTDVSRACGAGTGCGMCRSQVREMLQNRDALESGAVSPTAPLVPAAPLV